MLAARLAAVDSGLGAACRRAGRARGDVTLVAVTKTAPGEAAAELVGLGACDLGENRPQELRRKAAVLPPSVRWHLIGHLQRNKIERTLPLVHRIHSVDSLRLLQAASTQEAGAAAVSRSVDALLEVNASREGSKQRLFGAGGSRADQRLAAGTVDAGVTSACRGLMTMAAYEEDPQRCRPTFVALRVLRDRLRAAVGAAHSLADLSMGMTNDFEIAVEEGATLVRIGTALFEGLTA